MELGSWSIIQNGPSLLGLIPLVVYIVIALAWAKNSIIMALVPALVGALMCGWGPSQIGQALMNSSASYLGQIGILLMLGAGLGGVMQRAGVTKTLCKWIIQVFKINTQRRALLAIATTVFVISFACASVLVTAPLAAPMLIPIAAQFNIAPAVVAFAIFLFGSAGCHISPMLSDNLLRMEWTGFSFLKVISWSSLPYCIITVIATYFVCMRLNKTLVKKGELYAVTAAGSEAVEIAPHEKRTTIAFLVAFIGCLAYIFIANPGFKFAFFYMLFLAAVVTIFSKENKLEMTDHFIASAAKSFGLYFTIVLGDMLMNTISAMGGFEALANFFSGFVSGGSTGSEILLYIIAMLFGVFGVNGIGTTQAMIINSTFEPLYSSMGINMGIWCMVLCIGTMVSVIMYPSGAHFCYLGAAQTQDMKTMIKGCWTLAAIQLIFGILFVTVMALIV